MRWVAAEKGEVPQAFVAAFDELAASARQDGVKVARLSFPATADIEEVLRIFAESGEFDIFKGEGKTVRRLA